MNPKLKVTILILAFLILPSLVWGKQWVVGAGDSIVLRIKDVSRIAIGSPDIADATVVSPDEILINGKKEGETSLHVWVPEGVIPYRIRVLGDNFPIQEIRKIEGLEGVKTSILKGNLVLGGQVETKEQAAIAEKLARSSGKEVVNLIRITEPLAELREIEGLEMVSAYLIGDTLILKGKAATEAEAKLAQSLAEAEYDRVVNLIKVAPTPNLEEPGVEKEIEIYRGIVKEKKVIKEECLIEDEPDEGSRENKHPESEVETGRPASGCPEPETRNLLMEEDRIK
ncbi:MAG: pilus assembly protein N-terminal domain-containing protein [bacterium]|nr:pilus assembly protein N-terminal domain-containing protein [bacterium]